MEEQKLPFEKASTELSEFHETHSLRDCDHCKTFNQWDIEQKPHNIPQVVQNADGCVCVCFCVCACVCAYMCTWGVFKGEGGKG